MPKSISQSPTLTERQKKWFASVRAGLERDTGRPLGEWVAIACKCPETKTAARVKWLGETYGVGVNRAAAVPSERTWDDPEALLAALRKICDRLETAAKKLEGAAAGPRKTVSTFSREAQYAAAKPVKGGARLALAPDPKAAARLEPTRKSEGFNERLKAAATLANPAEVGAEIQALLKKAWESA